MASRTSSSPFVALSARPASPLLKRGTCQLYTSSHMYFHALQQLASKEEEALAEQ